MDVVFDAPRIQLRAQAAALGRTLPSDAQAAAVVGSAASADLLRVPDLLSAAGVVDALAYESPSAGMVLGLHLTVAASLAGTPWERRLREGDAVGAVTLSAAELPVVDEGRLNGRAALVAPVVSGGVVILGARRKNGDLAALVIEVDAHGVGVEPLTTSALRGVPCADVRLAAVAAGEEIALPAVMARARLAVAAAGLGIGRRALAEALDAAKRAHGAGSGEQTVQGLLADSATELDAASLLLWRACASTHLTLGQASLAKLAVASAVQRTVARATQVIGVDSFQEGHIVERLSRDVRALELFAGRTEALREAAAEEMLPKG